MKHILPFFVVSALCFVSLYGQNIKINDSITFDNVNTIGEIHLKNTTVTQVDG